MLVEVGQPLLLDEWLKTAPERPHHAFTVELRRLLESVSRTAITAADVVARDRLLAAVGGALAAERRVAPIAASAFLHSTWPAMLAEPRVATATDIICEATARAGGKPVSARDCALMLYAAGERIAGAPAWTGQLIARAPFALVAAALHLPALRFIWWLSRKISEVPSERAARAIVPGFYLMFGWYALLGALLAFGMAAAGWSWLVVLPTTLLFVRLLPRLGDFAVASYHEWSGHRLVRRVRQWSEQDRAAIQESMYTLQSACTPHIHGPAVSSLA